jgi:2-aminoadipate transaminase
MKTKRINVFRINLNGVKMQYILAERTKTLKASEIRELLKVTEQPEIISFAGGLPDPALFPIEELAKMSQTVFATDAHAAL